MDTWDAITSRRNVREFADRPIPPDDLDRILEAGRRTPSSRNWQPWDFVLVTDRARLRELAKVWQFARHVADAAAAIVIVGEPQELEMQRDWLQFDSGQAMMAMMIEAADLGIGTGHAAIADQALLRRLLGVPDDRFGVALFSLGYPAGRPLKPLRRPDRRPFEDVVHREHW